MTSTIRRILALIISIMLSLGVFFAVSEEKTIDDEVVITYNGGEVTFGEAANFVTCKVNNAIAEISLLYMSNGVQYTPTDQEYAQLFYDALNAYAQRKILTAKMLELGFEEFTEEFKAEARAEAEAQYAEMVQSYVTSFSMSEEQAQQLLYSQGYSADIMYEDILFEAVLDNLDSLAQYDTVVTDEDALAAFEALVEKDKKKYSENPSDFELSVENGTNYYYVPDGTRYVKHILLITEDAEFKAEYDAAVTAVRMYEAEIATLSNPSYKSNYEPVIQTAMLVEAKENLVASKEALSALETEYITLMQTEITAVETAVANGESFDALIEAYSKDTGSLSEPVKTNGYLVVENSGKWEPGFVEASATLKNIGDVSEPVLTAHGIHILLYVSGIEAGPVAFEEVKETIVSDILAERKEAAVSSQYAAWLEEANIQFVQ